MRLSDIELEIFWYKLAITECWIDKFFFLIQSFISIELPIILNEALKIVIFFLDPRSSLSKSVNKKFILC